MQPCQEHRAKADIDHLTDIQPGDYFYMCSDGMLEQTSDENLLNVITKPEASNEKKLEMLRKMTDENKDNHTAHLIYIDKVKEKVRIVENAASHFSIRGLLVTPEFDKPKKKWNVVAPVIAVIIAACLLLFFFPRRNNTAETNNANSPHSTKVQQPKTNGGTQTNGTRTCWPTGYQSNNNVRKSKQLENKKANNDTTSSSKKDQPKAQKDTAKPSLPKEVANQQPKKRTTQPNDKEI